MYRAGGTNPFASPGELSCPVRVRVLVRVSRLGPRLRLRLRSRRVPESSTCRVNSLRSVSAPGPSHTCPFGSTRRCRPRCRCREYGRGPLRCLSSSFRARFYSMPIEHRVSSVEYFIQARSRPPAIQTATYHHRIIWVPIVLGRFARRPSTVDGAALGTPASPCTTTTDCSTLESCYFALPFTLSCDCDSERVAGLLSTCVLAFLAHSARFAFRAFRRLSPESETLRVREA